MGVKVVPKIFTVVAASILLGTLGAHAVQYPYPAEPQYQYPRTDGGEMKCPKGKRPFLGKFVRPGLSGNWRPACQVS